MMEFTKLLMTRSELAKLSSNVEPKGTNQLQAQYIDISENISLHRKARSTLNKDRVCICVACVCVCVCLSVCLSVMCVCLSVWCVYLSVCGVCVCCVFACVHACVKKIHNNMVIDKRLLVDISSQRERSTAWY